MSGMISVLAKNEIYSVEDNPNYKLAEIWGDNFFLEKEWTRY